MLANVTLVGTVAELPEITTTTKGTPLARMVVECERPFLTTDKEVIKDQFRILMWKGVAEETSAAVKVGSIVVIKGRLQSDVYEKEERKFYNCEVVAEKVRMVAR